MFRSFLALLARFSVPRVFALSLSAGIVSCSGDSWIGEHAAPPAPGTRIPVLEKMATLEIAQGLKERIRLPKPEVNKSWPQQGGYPHHAMHHMQISAEPDVAWRQSIGAGSGRRNRLMGEPIVADETVYVVDTEGTASALDATTGHIVWQTDLLPPDEDTNTLMGGGVALNQGRIFVTTGFAEVIALDARDGREIWRQRVTAPLRSGPTVSEGRVFVNALDNKAFALSAETGSIIWTYSGVEEPTAALGSSAPTVSNGVVLFSFTSGEVVALRVDTGSPLWSDQVVAVRRTDASGTLPTIAARTVVNQGRAFVLGHSGLLVSIDMRTGERAWELKIGGVHQPWIAGSWLFTTTIDGRVVAVDAVRGRVAWIADLPLWQDPEEQKGRITWTGPILASDRLIVAGSEGHIVSIHPYDGSVLGRIELGSGISLSPVIAQDSLYMLTDDGDVVCLR